MEKSRAGCIAAVAEKRIGLSDIAKGGFEP
jgi:hypothetical protein